MARLLHLFPLWWLKYSKIYLLLCALNWFKTTFNNRYKKVIFHLYFNTKLLDRILIIIKRIYQVQRTVGNCASVIYFMTVGIHGVKFEHDRLNHSQVPWKLRNLCRRILFFLRNLLVAQYSRIYWITIAKFRSPLFPFNNHLSSPRDLSI